MRPGYDLLALLTGSEGMLARDHRSHGQAAAEAARRAQVVLAAFDDVEKAGDAVADDHRRRHHSRPGWR